MGLAIAGISTTDYDRAHKLNMYDRAHKLNMYDRAHKLNMYACAHKQSYDNPLSNYVCNTLCS